MCSGSSRDVAHPGGALLDRPVLTEADRIVARLNEPAVAAAINQLLDRADLIAALLASLDAAGEDEVRRGLAAAVDLLRTLGRAEPGTPAAAGAGAGA